jgi:hypothetical protein
MSAVNHAQIPDTPSGLCENARKQIKVDSSRQTNIMRIKVRKAKVRVKKISFFLCNEKKMEKKKVF